MRHCANGRYCRKGRVWVTALIFTLLIALPTFGHAAERMVELPDGTQARAVFGHVVVPLRRHSPSAETITIPYVRVLSESDQKKTPLIHLAGGPGSSGIAALENDTLGELLDDALKTRDVVYFDQRGTGNPDGKLYCWLFHHFPLVPAPSVAEHVEVKKRLAGECASRLRARGVDLTPYNNIESADDVADLAKHLGEEKIILVGTSYGSTLAMAVVRRHEALVDRALLVGVTDPDSAFRLHDQIENVLFTLDSIAADPGSSWPLETSPSAAVKALLQQFGQPKLTTSIDEYDREIDIEISQFDVERMLFREIGAIDHWQSLPARIVAIRAALQKDDWSSLLETVFSWRHVANSDSLRATILCSRWASDERLKLLEKQKKTSLVSISLTFPIPEECEDWGIDPLPAVDRAPFESDVPVLMVSGTLDAKTPPRNAVKLAERLPNAAHLQVSGMAHSLYDAYMDSPAFRLSILNFLDGMPAASGHYSIPFEFDALDEPGN